MKDLSKRDIHSWLIGIRILIKKLDLVSSKIYSSASLQMHISKLVPLLFHYDYLNWDKVPQFIEKLPQGQKELRSLVSEGQLVAQTSLQAILDVSDMVVCSMSTSIAIHRASWLQSSGITQGEPNNHQGPPV